MVKDISGEPVEGATVMVYQVLDEYHDACTFVENSCLTNYKSSLGAIWALTFTQQYLVKVHKPLRGGITRSVFSM